MNKIDKICYTYIKGAFDYGSDSMSSIFEQINNLKKPVMESTKKSPEKDELSRST